MKRHLKEEETNTKYITNVLKLGKIFKGIFNTLNKDISML
jgi:hypothetical protein